MVCELSGQLAHKVAATRHPQQFALVQTGAAVVRYADHEPSEHRSASDRRCIAPEGFPPVVPRAGVFSPGCANRAKEDLVATLGEVQEVGCDSRTGCLVGRDQLVMPVVLDLHFVDCAVLLERWLRS